MPNIRQETLECLPPPDNFSGNSAHTLDTSAQLRKPLLKRAKSKHFTNKLAIALAEQRNEFEQYYRNAFYCNHDLTQVGNVITGKYCKTRICNTCNRIRMANLIDGYSPVLDKFSDLQFMTLTIPNCPGADLSQAITTMWKSFVKVIDRLRKRGIHPSGLRKLEITYNVKRKDYHPHYHVIVSSKEVATAMLTEWMKLNPTSSIKAQDIRPVTAGAQKELFKYTAKVVTKINCKQVIVIDAVDTIIRALHKRRIIQPFGEIRKEVSEDIEEVFELDAARYDIPDYELMSWKWYGDDWVNEYGELLTGYTPSDFVTNISFDYS